NLDAGVVVDQVGVAELMLDGRNPRRVKRLLGLLGVERISLGDVVRVRDDDVDGLRGVVDFGFGFFGGAAGAELSGGHRAGALLKAGGALGTAHGAGLAVLAAARKAINALGAGSRRAAAAHGARGTG